MENKHHLTCPAPICQDDPNLNFKSEVVWRPGESVCKKTPYQKFQKKQMEINRLVKKGKFKNMDYAYTASQLENSSV